MKYIIIIGLLMFFSKEAFGQNRKIGITGSGWLAEIRENNLSSKEFVIGIWGIPQYKAIHNKSRVSKSDLIQSQKSFSRYGNEFDLIFTHSEYLKHYMSDQIIMTGSSEFSYIFRDYMKRNDIGFVEGKQINMEKLSIAYNSGKLDKEINNGFKYLKQQFSSRNNWTYILAPIDEVVSWPPSLIKGLYKQAKTESGGLVYCDLLGSGKANSFVTRNKILDINKNNGVANYIKNWTLNIQKVAKEYSGCGDIYGINAYGEFYEDPVLAGNAVDAIKSILGSATPVWLWFDPVGYAKPKNVQLSEYIKNVKCQIYTSIIHGATGVLLYNDLRKAPSDFDLFAPILKELKSNKQLFLMETSEFKQNEHIHLCIKINHSTGERYLISSNTNTREPMRLSYGKISKLLKPLEVYISKL